MFAVTPVGCPSATSKPTLETAAGSATCHAFWKLSRRWAECGHLSLSPRPRAVYDAGAADSTMNLLLS